jgi:pimeloyl-ACP methyl ester carboxylesterase
VDENRVFIAGVSRGGHLCWDILLRRPDLFAAAVPMIGGPRLTNTRGESNLRYLENAAALRIRDLQGAEDDRLLLDNLHLAFERLQRWKVDAVLHEFPGLGHDFRFGAEDWVAFLAKARRAPVPPRVVRRAARPGEGRAFWAEILKTGKGVDETFPFTPDAARWKSLDEEGRRKEFLAETEKRTARLEVRCTAPGKFEAEGGGVERFRLLLDASLIAEGKPVEVAWQGKVVSRPARADRHVLLEEFVERFDRTFLPTVEVTVP